MLHRLSQFYISACQLLERRQKQEDQRRRSNLPEVLANLLVSLLSNAQKLLLSNVPCQHVFLRDEP